MPINEEKEILFMNFYHLCFNLILQIPQIQVFKT